MTCKGIGSGLVRGQIEDIIILETLAYFSWSDGALEHFEPIRKGSVVVLEVPMQGRLIGMEVRNDLGPREEPTLPAVQGFSEPWSVEMEGHAGPWTSDPKAQGNVVARQGQPRDLVLIEERLPFGAVVVPEEVERLWKRQMS